MNGPSDLFILKQIAVFNQKNDDWIVSIESNKKDELLFGTSKGKIIRFRINNGELAYCDSLFLSVRFKFDQIILFLGESNHSTCYFTGHQSSNISS